MGLLDLDENDINIEIIVIKSLIEQYIKSPILTPYYDRGIIWVDECCDWPTNLNDWKELERRYVYNCISNGFLYLAVNKMGNIKDKKTLTWFHVRMKNYKRGCLTLNYIISSFMNKR